jgi:hypothetical protein
MPLILRNSMPLQELCVGDLRFCSLLENTLQVWGRDPFPIFENSFEDAVGRVCEGTTQAMHYWGSSEGRALC